jgi:cytochrome P450
MPLVSELDLPTFDYMDSSLVGERFHEVLNDLRDESWVAKVDLGYVLLDHASVDWVLRTRDARMPAIELLELQGVTSGPMHEQLSGNLLNLHGEQHRRLRGLVEAPFTPRAAERLRPAMREHLEVLWRDVADAGACEFVSALAKPYPARMIAEIVGAPVEDAERLGEWAYWLQSVFDPSAVAGAAGKIERAGKEFTAYVRELLRTPRPEGGEALLDSLHAAMDDGQLSETECIGLVGAVLIGGVDTTQAQLAHGVRLLGEHPEQWQALCADPGLVPSAVEEILRYEPITPFTARLTSTDAVHRDVTFPAGTVLIACALSANHDPAAFTEPERFDITAGRKGKLLTFGAGPHHCLGASLARAELEEALAFLVERAPAMELDGPPRYGTPPGVYGLHELPIRFARTPAAATATTAG